MHFEILCSFVIVLYKQSEILSREFPPPPPSLFPQISHYCIYRVSDDCSMYGRPVLIKFSSEASPEICVEGGGIREWVAMETKAFNKRRCGALSVKPRCHYQKGQFQHRWDISPNENTSSIKHEVLWYHLFRPLFFFFPFYISHNLWLIKISGAHCNAIE